MSEIRCALYTRVSTVLLGQSLDNQIVPLRSYAQARGFTIYQEYFDEGVSGAKDCRPSLNLLMQDARRRKFDVIVVAALDRLSRSTKSLLVWLHELRSIGVNVISLREAVDFNTPMGQAMAAFIGILAEIERANISERIKIALATKKLLAEKSGSSWKAGRKFIVNDHVVNEVHRLHLKGLSIRKIVTAMDGRIGRSSVLRILHGYRGEVSHQPPDSESDKGAR